MITLYFLNGQAFIWNADDWLKIRTQFRIMGELIGTIATLPRQDVYQGFPMSLMTEEAAILVENGFCKIISYSNINETPNEDIVRLAESVENRLYSEQVECVREKRIKQLSSQLDNIVSGKRKKLSKDRKTCEFDREQLLQQEIEKIIPPPMENSLIQIPTENPWPHEVRSVSIEELIPSIKSDIGHIRYMVFKDLWNRGFTITSGTKFGGDPVKFHAVSIVKCVKCVSATLNLPDVVALGRLGVSVNKITVFAYLIDNNVKYQTLQWHDTLY